MEHDTEKNLLVDILKDEDIDDAMYEALVNFVMEPRKVVRGSMRSGSIKRDYTVRNDHECDHE